MDELANLLAIEEACRRAMQPPAGTCSDMLVSLSSKGPEILILFWNEGLFLTNPFCCCRSTVATTTVRVYAAVEPRRVNVHRFIGRCRYLTESIQGTL